MRLINEPTTIAEITLVREDGRGWIATLENGETAWVIGDTRELCKSIQGDVIVAALERHQRYPAPHWYASWAVPEGEVSLASIERARYMLKSGPFTSGEIGANAGDILYHAGEVAKFVKFDRKKTLDPETDIHYTLYPDNAGVVEYEDGE